MKKLHNYAKLKGVHETRDGQSNFNSTILCSKFIFILKSPSLDGAIEIRRKKLFYFPLNKISIL